jgi:hypothetical protein
LERWEAFINEMAPDLSVTVAREAKALRTLHAELNDECPLTLTLSPETGARDSMGVAAPISPSPLEGEGRVRGNQ